MILPSLAEAARAIVRWLLIALAAAALWACSSEDAPVEQTSLIQPTVGEQETALAPISQPERSQFEPPTARRTPGDPAHLLVSEAAALEDNGYWERALAVRQTAIAAVGNLDATELAALRLDNAQLLLKLRRPAEARSALMTLTETGGLTPGQERRRLLLEASAAMALSETDAGLAAMSDYVNSDSPAWASISLEIARTLQSAGRGGEAIEWAERALGGDLPFQDQLRAIHLAATELDIAGDEERALGHYDELLERSPWRDDQALALSRSAVLQSARGESDAAYAAWLRLVENYPSFAESWEALESLLEAGVEVGQLEIGLIRIEQQRWPEARQTMLTLLSGSNVLDEQVAGEFYIAAIHEANSDPASAALGYVAVIGRDRTHPLAAESAMRLAEFAVADGDLSSPQDYWRQVLLEHPQHARAVEAGRRWATAPARASDWTTASQRFQEAAEIAREHWSDAELQEFLFWSALLAQQAGDTATAAELFDEVLAIQPVRYYAQRVRALRSLDPPSLLDISSSEWLSRLTGSPPPSAADLDSAAGWVAALDLRRGGFGNAADRVLAHWISQLGDPWALAQAAEFLAEQGEWTASTQAASALLDWFGLYWTEAPVGLLRLAYPQPWPDVMALHSSDEAAAVDPRLLWSLIRRESLYDPDAQGLAGEIGLTQVIPLTGSDIAAGLGIEYEHVELAQPQLAIRFGAWYLARQLDGFSNEPIMALAAYNAGPGNAARWEDSALPVGVDGFLAALDFPSTRAYVQYVIETWAVYRALAAAE